MNTADLIVERLTKAFAPESIEVIDDSDKHRGHAGAAAGGGHFRVRLVSAAFEGLNQLERHRRVYAALAEEMTARIHALSIKAVSPAENPGDDN